MHEVSDADSSSPSIGVPQARIEILTDISGVNFDAAWANRMTVEIRGVQSSIIGRSDLIVNKRATRSVKIIGRRLSPMNAKVGSLARAQVWGEIESRLDSTREKLSHNDTPRSGERDS